MKGDSALIFAHHKGPQQDVIVWFDISFHSRIPLVVISETLTAQRYDILPPVLLQFLLPHPGLTFYCDNARLHTARVIMNCFQACHTLHWPARSPDLSPVEHISDFMRRKLQVSQNIDNLVQQLETIWHEILQDTIQ